MNMLSQSSLISYQMQRRQFLQGLAAGGVALGSLSISRSLYALNANLVPSGPSVLQGTNFNLTIAETPVNFTGAARMAVTVNGSIPAPTLRWREGETVTIRVTNQLAEDTSIHWHGILLPFQMDGVPGISFKGIRPGETFVYHFTVQQSGTYWYHSHSNIQEQRGLYGAIIIDPADADPNHADRDYVLQLSDWTDEHPMRVFDKLRKQSDYYNHHLPTTVDVLRDISRDGLKSAYNTRKMWNQMRMNPSDLADVSAHTYTYLINGITPTGNWTGLFRNGERVRLRIINSGAMTFFDVRIPGLKMIVVQADGQNVEPVTVDELRIGVAETYDVIVTPEDEAYTIFAQSMDRTGYARGTLATGLGLTAAVPELDAPVQLTMGDMMGNLNHNNLSPKAVMQHDTMAMNAAGGQVRHASTEYGPSTDMRVDRPRSNLDDPGIGLRHNGRRVLTYADLHTIGGPIDPRTAEREIELHLTGNMERYSWSFDGLEFGQSTPLHFHHGERLRIILHNDTMMTHPMHLHGMWSELENSDGYFQARKHVINVQPAQRVSFLVTADAVGRWAWHCHLLLHMEAGMFREVIVV